MIAWEWDLKIRIVIKGRFRHISNVEAISLIINYYKFSLLDVPFNH